MHNEEHTSHLRYNQLYLLASARKCDLKVKVQRIPRKIHDFFAVGSFGLFHDLLQHSTRSFYFYLFSHHLKYL